MKNGELIYDQAKGILFHRPPGDDAQTTRLGKGYSGHPPYVNQTEAERLVARGPIPRGRYRVGAPFRHNRLGPVALYLEPRPGNEMHGRSGFFIHGDNAFGDQSASYGCIILPRGVRERVGALVPIDLVVV